MHAVLPFNLFPSNVLIWEHHFFVIFYLFLSKLYII